VLTLKTEEEGRLVSHLESKRGKLSKKKKRGETYVNSTSPLLGGGGERARTHLSNGALDKN